LRPPAAGNDAVVQRSDLVELVAEPRRVVTTYLVTTGRADPDAVAAQVAHRLAALDHSWATDAELRPAVAAAIEHEAAGVAAFLTEGRAPAAYPLADPPAEDLVVEDDLPYVAPLVEASLRDLRHLTVQADPGQTTLTAFPSVDSEPTQVQSAGLTSATVAQITGDVVALADRTQADLVIIDQRHAGTADLVAAVATHLPPHRRLREVSDGKRELADAVVALVADAAARDVVEVVQDYRFALVHGGAVSGVDATVDALAAGRVVTLLLHDDPHDSRTVAIGRGATHIGPTARAGSGEERWTVRLSSGLIRSCLLSGGEVRIIPEHVADGPDEGVGAVLVR
jgi:hypothetical protein